MASTPPSLGVSRASTAGSSATGAGNGGSYLPSTSSFISNFFRRLSSDTAKTSGSPSLHHSATFPSGHADLIAEENDKGIHSMERSNSNIYTPPHRTASPFQPPPLWPLSLNGWHDDTPEGARLLSKGVAEEIRLLVPPRLQLVDEWQLIYSLEQDGVSLGTMYKKCEELRGRRNGYVLVVKDGDGGLFGAYLSEAPHISAHYFGTGECFLWRASTFEQTPLNLQSQLPLPPSADTTNMQRSTTITTPSPNTLAPPTAPPTRPTSPASMQIRFKAFPYSGINDYLMLCDQTFFSIGGGDGKYGLWLDNTFERGISSTSLTFGNEPLSEEGEKFEILGVELWAVGNLE